MTSEVEEELSEIQATMEDQNKGLNMKQALRNLARYDVRTPFLLIIANFFLVNFTGQPIMVFYTVEIFQKTSQAVNKVSLDVVDIDPTLLLSVCCCYHSSCHPGSWRHCRHLPGAGLSQGGAQHGDDDTDVGSHGSTGLCSLHPR